MTRGYLLRRLLLVVPVLLGTTLLIYAMVFAIPGDPIRRLAGGHPVAHSTYIAVRHRYHLDRSFFVQYWYYLKGLSHGDFGETFFGQSVGSIIAERFPVTVRLTLGAFAVECLLGLDLAVLMGGAPITESIFNLPGLGQELVQGIQNENGPVVVGLVTLAALIFILTNLAVDLIVAYLDPRVGYG